MIGPAIWAQAARRTATALALRRSATARSSTVVVTTTIWSTPHTLAGPVLFDPRIDAGPPVVQPGDPPLFAGRHVLRVERPEPHDDPLVHRQLAPQVRDRHHPVQAGVPHEGGAGARPRVEGVQRPPGFGASTCRMASARTAMSVWPSDR